MRTADLTKMLLSVHVRTDQGFCGSAAELHAALLAEGPNADLPPPSGLWEAIKHCRKTLREKGVSLRRVWRDYAPAIMLLRPTDNYETALDSDPTEDSEIIARISTGVGTNLLVIARRRDRGSAIMLAHARANFDDELIPASVDGRDFLADDPVLEGQYIIPLPLWGELLPALAAAVEDLQAKPACDPAGAEGEKVAGAAVKVGGKK
jgi:hypothetical protein